MDDDDRSVWEGSPDEILEDHADLYGYDPGDVEELSQHLYATILETGAPKGLAAVALIRTLVAVAGQFGVVAEAVLDDAVALIDTFRLDLTGGDES